MKSHGLFIFAAVVGGCWNTEETALPEDNDALGIVKFVQEEVGDQTTLLGLNADGNEVARLELVHGWFKTSSFTDEYLTSEALGRKLYVEALGQKLYWDTAGFEPVLHMPAHPPTQWKLAAFLDDPHAKRILDQWQIGFEPFQGVGDGEVAFTSGNFRGHDAANCDGAATCGTGFFGTINTCGAGGVPFQADRVTQKTGTNCGLYTGPTNEEIRVAQCCPFNTGILGTDWFAQKVCPTTNNLNTACGTVPAGACKGCAGYPIDATQTCSTGTGSPVGTCSGSVYQLDFSYTASTYTYVKASTVNAGDAALNDDFGDTVAISGDGNTVAIGAPEEDSNATGINGNQTNSSAYGSGAVYVFTRSGTTWVQQAYVKASNTTSGDDFGLAVALSANGSTLVVGAISEDSNATGINGVQTDNSKSNSGAVYVFTRSGTTWSQQAYIKASNTDAEDQFGNALALSGDGNTLAVGVRNEDSNATGINGTQSDNSKLDSGAAYVFTRSGTVWSQQAYIKASNTDAGDDFGFGIALSDDSTTLAVGASDEDSNASGINGNQSDNSKGESGAVYVFTRSGTVWSQQAYIKASSTSFGDNFGEGVALSSDGNTLAAGAQDEDSNATGINGNQEDSSANDSGAAYVFTRSGTTWSQQAYIKASNTAAGDDFGIAVDLSDNGNTLAVGARTEDSIATGINGSQADNSATDSGAVYRFTRVGTTWSYNRYFKASNTEAGDQIGDYRSIALSGSGSILTMGTRKEDSNATGINGNQADNTAADAGAAYIVE